MHSAPTGAVGRPSSPGVVVSRRRVLIGAMALAALGAAGTACDSPPPPEPDPLIKALDLAHRDSTMAGAAAAAAGKFWAPVLQVVATQRADHARALAQEIAREAGEATASSATPTPDPSPTTTGAADPAPSRTDVVNALRESGDSATELAITLSGYRAGLLGSIAASCASAVAVPLAMKEPKP